MRWAPPHLKEMSGRILGAQPVQHGWTSVKNTGMRAHCNKGGASGGLQPPPVHIVASMNRVVLTLSEKARAAARVVSAGRVDSDRGPSLRSAFMVDWSHGLAWRGPAVWGVISHSCMILALTYRDRALRESSL